ncbi:MAG: hypothetical protein Ct9H90mP18_01010 [Gammaproteobacteria bacterium]|nr:MAG: hypothetical protein Ct9H90mP18_01010 [Gammaproteobacteria bacterium]
MVIRAKNIGKTLMRLFLQSRKSFILSKKEYVFFKGAFKDVGYAIQRTNPGEFFHWHMMQIIQVLAIDSLLQSGT